MIVLANANEVLLAQIINVWEQVSKLLDWLTVSLIPWSSYLGLRSRDGLRIRLLIPSFTSPLQMGRCPL